MHSGLPAHVLPVLGIQSEKALPILSQDKIKSKVLQEGGQKQPSGASSITLGHPISCTEIMEGKLGGFLDPSQISVQG